MAVDNPYHYGTPAQGEHFTGRQDELAALLSRLHSGINVVLISPRRYGKTSLLLLAERELAGHGTAALHVNVLRCRDVGTLAAQLATGAYRLPGGKWHRVVQAVPEFLRRIRVAPTVTFGGEHPTFTFGPRLEPVDAEGVIADVYALLSEIGGNRPAVMVLDEFQAIVALGGHLPALLKSLADAHSNVALVLAGSRRHIMEELVSDPTAALYGMAEKLELGPLPDDVMVGYLRERAHAGCKRMGEHAARLIVTLAGPVPNDIQRLAYEAYDAAAVAMDEPSIRLGLERAVTHEAVTYAERYERLPAGQRRAAIAIAEGPAAELYSADFVARTGLANASSVRKAVTALQSDELVVARASVVVVSDPFFAAWLRDSP